MIPKRIAGANVVMGPPEGWDDARQGKCLQLHVLRNNGRCYSAWEPTPAELEALNIGASVILSVVGGQPPVWLEVDMLSASPPAQKSTREKLCVAACTDVGDDVLQSLIRDGGLGKLLAFIKDELKLGSMVDWLAGLETRIAKAAEIVALIQSGEGGLEGIKQTMRDFLAEEDAATAAKPGQTLQ